MVYGMNIPPMGSGVPHGPMPNILFPRTPAYPTPNTGIENYGGMTEGVREQIMRNLRGFGFNPKGCARAYQKPYPEYFDTIPYLQGIRVPGIMKFNGDDTKTYEHVGQLLVHVNEVGITNIHKIRLFPVSLYGNAFNWFMSLAPNIVDTWQTIEQKIHDYFYNGEIELRLLDLIAVRQKYGETVPEYLQ
jgi:hypothetical protein